MAAWSGLGFNVKTPSADLAADMQTLRSIGVTSVRVHVPDITDLTEVAYWQDIARQWTAAGFYTVWGATPRAITSGNWSTLAQAVRDLATACQANAVCSEFQIGNECETHKDSSITESQIRTNLRSLATDVQAIFTRGLISYAVEGTSTANGDGTHGSQQWCNDAAKKGDLDLLSVNVYGVARSVVMYRDVWDSYKNVVASVYNTYAADAYISEWHLDAADSNIVKIPEEIQMQQLKKFYSYIQASGFTKALFFQWCGYKGMDNQFAIKLTDGGVSPLWDVLLQNARRTVA